MREIFLNQRLVFILKPNPVSKETAGQAAEKIEDKVQAYQTKRAEMIAQARQRAAQEKAKEQQQNLPPIKENFQGLRFDASKAKTRADGKIEQPVTFGDGKLQGKIVYPKNPDPNQKTTLIIRFSDQPSLENDRKLLEIIKKRKGETGNAIVVTIQTPGGSTVKFGREEADFMSTLVADLDTFYQKTGLRIAARPSSIITSSSRDDYRKNLKRILDQYKKAAYRSDIRIQNISHLNLRRKRKTVINTPKEVSNYPATKIKYTAELGRFASQLNGSMNIGETRIVRGPDGRRYLAKCVWHNIKASTGETTAQTGRRWKAVELHVA
jgi:hypothetical protein